MTLALLDDPQARQAVIERVEQVAELAAPSAPPATSDHKAELLNARAAWFGALYNKVLDVANVVPAGTEDYEVRQLLYFLIELDQAIKADNAGLDEDGKVALATARMADVAFRLLRRVQHSLLDVPDQAAEYVFAQLGSELTTAELAELFGVSAKTIGAWKAGGPVKTNSDRVRLVAHLVAYLRPSMTARGVFQWFEDPMDQLGSKRPLDVLAKRERRLDITLLQVARGSRGQLAD